MSARLALAGAFAWLAVACASPPFEVREYPLDLAPTDAEYVKYEALGEGTLPGGARALLGTIVTSGPVDAELVRETIVLRGQRLGHCYAGLLEGAPRTGGDLVLSARIDRDGVMRDVEPVYDAVRDASFAHCLGNGLEGLRFMEAERRPPTEVRLPLRFVPPVAVP